jgi:hypothetical protein
MHGFGLGRRDEDQEETGVKKYWSDSINTR